MTPYHWRLMANYFADQVALNKKKEADDILLDMGVNILVVFADNFGKHPEPGERLNSISVTKMDDRLQPAGKTRAADLSFPGSYMITKKKIIRVLRPILTLCQCRRSMNERQTAAGSPVSTSNEITLALWDDAVKTVIP